VGSYWPYLSTVWDYVHRAMPFGQAQSLSDDEVYALTAYILYLNDIVDDDFALSKETFAEVEMPNADGFFMDDREEVEPWTSDSAEACMTDCKQEVEITSRARVLDVTPADAAARKAAEEAAGGGQTASAETEAEPAAEEGPDPDLVAAGEKVWNKCRACHKVGEGASNGVGPHLNGLFGRTAGTTEGFRYSKAMETAGEDGLVWTEETLAEYLANPRKMVRGTRMAFAGLRDEEDIKAVLAYIEAQQP
jgi:cytochrome c